MKRTLTDEQIAMFRHSEIQSLLRQRRYQQEAQDSNSDSPAVPLPPPQDHHTTQENGEVSSDPASKPVVAAPQPQKKTKAQKYNQAKKNRKQQQKKGGFKPNVKPDLRKRTWDKVDEGLGSLDYGEEGEGETAGKVMQRRKISYEDD